MHKPKIWQRVDGVWEYTDNYSDEEHLQHIEIGSECGEGCPDSHEDPYDSTFYNPHQSEERLVEFDWLTVTIDEIMEKCAHPESKRGLITEYHLMAARDFLRYYKGPRPNVLPIIEETHSSIGAWVAPPLQGRFPWPDSHDDTRTLPEALQHKVLKQHIEEVLALYPEHLFRIRFGRRSHHDLHYGSRSVFASGLPSDDHRVRIGVRLDHSAETLRRRAHKDNDLYHVFHAHHEHQ